MAAEKSEIASHLGMTRETFSRTLSSLSFQGVSTDGRRLRVADVAAFQERFPSDPFIDDAETVAPLLSPAKSEGKATP